MSSDIWLPYFTKLSPAYEIFSWLPLDFLSQENWPELEEYNQLSIFLDQSLYNDKKMTLRFVSQAMKTAHLCESYEPRIYLKGEVQTRTNNWHDFFNMLIWHTFSKIKSELNKLQHFSLLQRAEISKQRSPLENFLTLFDENGVIIVSSDQNLLRLIKSMQWKEFFWYSREKLSTDLKAYVIGHSLHEKLLAPYIGMVGHSLLLLVDEAFFQMSALNQIAEIQTKICQLDLSSMTTKSLFPIPILGFPNWCADTNCASFYNDQQYFRIKRL